MPGPRQAVVFTRRDGARWVHGYTADGIGRIHDAVSPSTRGAAESLRCGSDVETIPGAKCDGLASNRWRHEGLQK